jgi:hypothetical protein
MRISIVTSCRLRRSVPVAHHQGASNLQGGGHLVVGYVFHRSERGDAREKQRFAAIDVADAGDHPLINEHVTNRSSRAGTKVGCCTVTVPRVIEYVRTEVPYDVCFSLCGQNEDIVQPIPHGCCITGVQDQADRMHRSALPALSGAVDVPRAIHSKVRM